MNLTELFYGQFTPPLASSIRRHTILGKEDDKYKTSNVPKIKYRVSQADSKENAELLYKIVSEYPGLTSQDYMRMMGVKHNQTLYTWRDILLSQDRITCIKETPAKRGGPRAFLFYVKG